MEPIALEISGAEIESTEEALAAFEASNSRQLTDPNWRQRDTLINYLSVSGRTKGHVTPCGSGRTKGHEAPCGTQYSRTKGHMTPGGTQHSQLDSDDSAYENGPSAQLNALDPKAETVTQQENPESDDSMTCMNGLRRV